MGKIQRRVQTLANREGFEADLDDEMRFHLEMETKKHIESGMTPAEARARAEREFGGMERAKDKVRDVRGVTWMDDVRRDVRFALRSLGRSPAFTIVAVLCLALGIGANAAVFSVLNAVLLRPLPYPEPDRLVRIYETMGNGGQGSVALPNYRDWVEQSTGFSQLAFWQTGSRNLLGSGGAERIVTVETTPNLFSLLGVRPLRGRTFVPGQDDPRKARIAVVSEAFWRNRFGGDPGLVGRAIQLDGFPYMVVGVMPEGFTFPPGGGTRADAWLLFNDPRADDARGAHFLAVAGRLKPGMSLEQATAQLVQVAARMAKTYPDFQTGRSVLVQPLQDTVVGRSRKGLLILFGAVALVLLIACANVANLLLARAAVRQREVAVRLALGAGRTRLIRQFLVESLVLALAGAALGTLLAVLSLRALEPLVAGALPISGHIPLDGRVFGFLLLAAALSGLLFGIGPALQASRQDLRDSLTEGGGKSTSSRRQQSFRSALVVLEIGISLVLLVGAGLLLRGFLRLSATPSGLVAENVLTAHLAVPAAQLKGVTARTFHPVLEKVRHLPGVRSAALISMLPIQDAWTNGSYQVEGRPPLPLDQQPLAEWRVASPGFFSSLGIPVLRGRDFAESDGGPGVRRVIINEALARKEFPGEDPVGKQLRIDKEAPHDIIGLVGSVRQAGLDQEPLTEIYFPYSQIGAEDYLGDSTLVIRTDVPPEGLSASVRGAVREVDPGLSLYNVQTMEEVVSRSLADRRLNLWLLGAFAGIALLLAAAGLYGVISYLVAQRTREIGVRLALGAQKSSVVGMVVRQGAVLVAAGIALGLVGSLAVTRVLESLLYGVSTRDPLTFVAIPALLAAVALLATWVPARRASRVDPMLAIRNE
ncbi:MAG: ADOP family duplicated permease [Thermoanaerobaculia bacterium]